MKRRPGLSVTLQLVATAEVGEPTVITKRLTDHRLTDHRLSCRRRELDEPPHAGERP